MKRVVDAQPDQQERDGDQQLTRGNLEPAPHAGEPGHHDADPDERERDVDDVPVGDREDAATDEALRDGLRSMLAFAYLGLEESGGDFGDVLEPAVRSCEEYLAAEGDERVSVDVTFDVETSVETSLSDVVSRLETGEPVTPRELFTVVMQGDHDATDHDRIAIADADDPDLADGFLGRLAAYLDGELRHVTDSRAVIDLGE